jgi:two-component sensor histidine kinase
MSHRVKNLFSIAAALARISSRSATTPKEMAEDITRRLYALGVAHQLIRPSLGAQKKAVQLRDLLAVLLGAYDDKGEIGDRIHISVPEVLVGEAAITSMALVVHELATNSIKYGSLSAASGTLQVVASVTDSQVRIVWTEKGGPPVNIASGSEGFGSKLVKKSITDHLGGAIKFDWPTGGAVVTLTMSKHRLGS